MTPRERSDLLARELRDLGEIAESMRSAAADGRWIAVQGDSQAFGAKLSRVEALAAEQSRDVCDESTAETIPARGVSMRVSLTVWQRGDGPTLERVEWSNTVEVEGAPAENLRVWLTRGTERSP